MRPPGPFQDRLHTLALLRQNIAIRRSALPLPYRVHTAWARGLGLRRGGETVIYTGQMFQMLPFLSRLQGVREKGERMGRLARVLNPLVNLSYLASSVGVKGEERRRYEGILRRMVALLRAAGQEPAYLYERDLYPGTLAYDLGLHRLFERHARRVARAIQEAGVRRIICVDPHSTELFRRVYPQVVEGFRVEAVHWMEPLLEAGGPALRSRWEAVALHDSCILARRLGLGQGPRSLLEKGGAQVGLPRLSGSITQCCGGPAETLFPQEALALGRERMEQMEGLEGPVVTACPICLLNLQRAGGRAVVDLAEALEIAG